MVSIQITGLEEKIAALKQFPEQFDATLEKAGEESGHEVIETYGIKQYPASTAANAPPYPYYERGKGTWVSPARNLMNSERYGTNLTVGSMPGEGMYIQAQGKITIIGARASYAQFIGGDNQSAAMARIGWRRWGDVAQEKTTAIHDIYEGWIKHLLVEVGLS